MWLFQEQWVVFIFHGTADIMILQAADFLYWNDDSDSVHTFQIQLVISIVFMDIGIALHFND